MPDNVLWGRLPCEEDPPVLSVSSGTDMDPRLVVSILTGVHATVPTADSE